MTVGSKYRPMVEMYKASGSAPQAVRIEGDKINLSLGGTLSSPFPKKGSQTTPDEDRGGGVSGLRPALWPPQGKEASGT